MAKSPRKTFKKLYIGEWINRRGRYPAEVADKIGYSEGYMSEIISGKKKNPSTQFLLAIADDLDLTLNDLYSAPPSEEVLKNVGKLSPTDQATLSRLLKSVKSSK